MHIEEINQTLFNQMPEYNSFEKSNHKQTMGRRISSQTYGRTNLDAAYHGFYLTPNYQEAYKWATKIKGLPGQSIQVKIDKEKIRKHCKVLCFPNEEWLKFIINNRKKTTIRNLVKCSYTLRADGKMNVLDDVIQTISDGQDISLYLALLVNSSLLRYQNSLDNYLDDEKIKEMKLLQLCISSPDLLNAIEIIDIINIDKEEI